MQRPYRRLESKQSCSPSSKDMSPSQRFFGETDFDEEAEVGLKGKPLSLIPASVVTISSTNTLLIGCCALIMIFVFALTVFYGYIFSPAMPTSLSNFLNQEEELRGPTSLHVMNWQQDSTMFYSSQSVNLRYCNSSVGYNSNRNYRFGADSSLSVAKEDIVSVIVYAGDSRHSHVGFNNFIASLKFTGFKHIHIIEPPESTREINKYTHANYSGEAHFWKERLQYFYQKASTFPHDSILLFCDAFDTLFTQPPSILLKRFRLFDSDIVFSTEILCDTVSCRRDLLLKDFFVSIAPKTNPYKYINAGMFMGKAFAMKEFMLCALKYANNGRDDQTAFSHCFYHFYMNNNNFSLANNARHTSSTALTARLDYQSFLFGNIPPVSDLFENSWDFQTSRADASYEIFEIPFLYRKHTLRTPLTSFPLYYSPVAIHFPGISFRPTQREQRFNPCQQFLKWRYNEIGQTIFTSGRIPNLAYGFISKVNRRLEKISMLGREVENKRRRKRSRIIEGRGEDENRQRKSSRNKILSGAPVTLFDINEVSSREHQEMWLVAFYNGKNIDLSSKWVSMKQEAEKNSKPDWLAAEESIAATSAHVSGSISMSERKHGPKKLSRVSKLFSHKIDTIEQSISSTSTRTRTARRRLQVQEVKSPVKDGDYGALATATKGEQFEYLIESLFNQKATVVQPERIILIETVDVGCLPLGNKGVDADSFGRNSLLDSQQRFHIIQELCQYLSENLQAIYKNNVYWKPDKIVLRIKFSPCMAQLYEEAHAPPSVEDQLFSGIQQLVNDTKNVHVVCSVHANLDFKFFNILKHEGSDAVIVLLEKELNFNMAALREIVEGPTHIQASSRTLLRASLEMQSVLPVSLPLPLLYLDTLLKTFFRTPIYAYGFSGLFVEMKERSMAASEAATAAADPILLSTNHLVHKSPIPVDILNLRGGLIFRRGMLYMLRTDFAFLEQVSASPDCHCVSESLLVSAILSRNKISRVHIPFEGEFDVKRQRHVVSSGNMLLPHQRVEQAAALAVCLRCLLPTLQKDWIDPTNMKHQPPRAPLVSSPVLVLAEHNITRHTHPFKPEISVKASPTKVSEFDKKRINREKLSSCDTPTFQALPQIDNLPGFSFQSNWDPASATSPCTQHLMTRYEESETASAGILGAGQFMTENQTIFSPTSPFSSSAMSDAETGKPPFMIKLETGARLCSYAVQWSRQQQGNHSNTPTYHLLSCLLPPLPFYEVPSTHHYAAITEGELCFYKGTAPHFGGTRQESGHRELAWCTAPTEMNIQMYDKSNEKKDDNVYSQKSDQIKRKKSRQKSSSAYFQPHSASSPHVLFPPSSHSHERKLRNESNGDINSFLHQQTRKLRAPKRDVGELVKKTFKARSHDVVMLKVQGKCILKVIPPDMYLNTYLHINLQGVFGLFVSSFYASHDIVPPSARIPFLKAARCFKKFDSKLKAPALL